MRRARDHEGGFTLLETLVALAILSLVLTGAYEAWFQLGNSFKSAEEKLDLRLLAESKLAEIRASPDLAEGNLSGQTGTANWEAIISQGPSGTLLIDIKLHKDQREIRLRTLRMK